MKCYAIHKESGLFLKDTGYSLCFVSEMENATVFDDEIADILKENNSVEVVPVYHC